MSDDPRDLLTEAAPHPARPVDVGQVVTTARRRRVRTRALAATATIAVVAAAVVGVSSLSSGDSNSVAVRAGTPTTSATPPGWSRVGDGGVDIAIPPGWHAVAPQPGVTNLLVVGAATSVEAPVFACVDASPDTPPAVTGTWVGLLEHPDPTTAPPRPADFQHVSTGVQCPAPGSPNAITEFEFLDTGRVFTAWVLTLGSSDAAAQVRLGEQVLNTLRVAPRTTPTTATTATTAPATTTLPAVTTPTTAAPPSSGSLSDRQQIERAFLGWLDGKTLDEAAPYVEDFPSIRDSEAQGFAQHTPQDIAGFSGRVESVVVADPTHADVVYTLLHDGQPMYANRPGKAVKVGGTWKVTRDTACALLAIGGITCPARTTPAP